MEIAVLIISVASMGGIGLILSLILVVADKKLAVKEDPRVEQPLAALCLLYTSPSPRDRTRSRMPSSA